MIKIKKQPFYQRLALFRKFLSAMQVKPVCIILPVFLSFMVASLEGVSVGLLIPLAKGLVSDFSFIKDIPLLRNLITFSPAIFPDSLSANKTIFLTIVILVFLGVLLKNTLYYINCLLVAYWYGRFHRNTYKFVFDRFLSFGKMFFDRTSQGYLNTILNYSDRVNELLRSFQDLVNGFFMLLVYFIIMLLISWKLTLITVLIFPIQHFMLRLIIKRINYAAELKNKSLIFLWRNIFNILSCIPLIKAYSKEEEIKNKYAKINEELRILEFNVAKNTKLIFPIQEVIMSLAMLLMITFVALLLSGSKPEELSVFVVFFYAAKKCLPLFNIFYIFRSDFAQLKPPLKEMFKIFDEKDKFFFTGGNEIFPGLQDKIEFKHLVFSYIKETRALKDISLTLEKGKVTAIVGPTGSGKTTLISLLMRLYDCPPASIFIDGKDIRSFTLASLREHMTLVSQETFLFNDTLRNNIVFGLDGEAKEEKLVDVTTKARIYDFISRLPLGFDTEIGDRGVRLSGGEKQRIAIARALLKGSEILILDEATSSLDSKTEAFIQQAINEAIKGRTTIVIAHRLSTIKNADKILVLEEGRLVEEGCLDELLVKKGKFYEYWEAQKFY